MEIKFKMCSLAEYLNTSDYNGMMKNRGAPIRKWTHVPNAEWAYDEDFKENVKKRIFERICCSQRAKLKETPDLDSAGKFNEHGYTSITRKEGGFDVVDRSKTSKQSSETADDAKMQISLQDKGRKEMLLGASKALNPLDTTARTREKTTREQSTQTEGTKLQNCAKCRNSYVVATRNVDDCLNQVQFQQVQHTTKTDTCARVNAPAASSVMQGQLVASSTPSLLGDLPQLKLNVGNPTSYDSHLNTEEYEKAKNWTPKDNQQKEAFEQTKSDLFNVLLVAKGCALRGISGEFNRCVQESLDLTKMGIPDIRTLLVQMGDLIYLKKERYTERVYVFPTMSNDKFDTVAHIGELVAEQRIDKNYSVPHPSTLSSCDIQELFQRPPLLYQAPNLQTSFYGSYSNPNYVYYPPVSRTSMFGIYQPPQNQNQYPQYLASASQIPNCSQYFNRYGQNGQPNYYQNQYR